MEDGHDWIGDNLGSQNQWFPLPSQVPEGDGEQRSAT